MADSSLSLLSFDLRNLSLRLHDDREVSREIDKVVALVTECAGTFGQTYSEHKDRIYNQGCLLKQAVDPGQINITKIKNVLGNARISFKESSMEIKSVQFNIHALIEKCRQHMKDHKHEQKSKKTKIQYYNSKIENLEDDIERLDNEADEKERRANDLDRRGRELDEKAKEKVLSGAVTGLVGAGAALLLVPFTAGGSLVAVAAGGIGMGAQYVDAAICFKEADEERSNARSKRYSASAARSKIRDIRTKIKSLEGDISTLKSRICALEKAVDLLERVARFSTTSVRVMYEVDDAIQEFDEKLQESLLSSESFTTVQKAYDRNPRVFRMAERHLAGLQSSWDKLEQAMEKNNQMSLK